MRSAACSSASTSPTPSQIEDAVNTAVDLGPLRALVNSAGIGWAQRTIGKDGEFASAHNLDAYKKVLAINLVGTFDCIRLAATAMSRIEPTETGERGAIVNMTSVAAFDGQIGQAAYSSSKGGVVGLTLPVARDLSAVGHPRQHRRSRSDRHARSTARARRRRRSRRSSASRCCSRTASASRRSSRRW